MEDKLMHSKLSRRSFVKTLASGALVLGFDPLTRSWVTSAEAASRPDFEKLPPLDGTLHLDNTTRATYADDFGHIVHERPLAVLKPGSVKDIGRMVKFARRYGVRITARGQGHTTFGQSQVRAGVVVDTSTLHSIHTIADDYARVDTGVRWNALLRATLERGLTPPVLTDYLGLSIGGTLSVGGVGGMSYRHGAQVDNLLELQVVTGEGAIVTCSESHRRDLFEAALAGQGQCALITQAVIRLIPAPTMVRVFDLIYPDLATLTRDLALLIDDGRLEFVTGWAFPTPDGGWIHMLESASFFTPPALPDNAELLAGLSYLPGPEEIRDQSYAGFANRLADLPKTDIWNVPHPWIDPIVPGSAIDTLVGEIEETLKPLAAGDTFSILMLPFQTARFTRPLFRVPDEEKVIQLGILRNAPPDPNVVARIVDYNRTLYDRNRDLGGTHYPISAVRLTRHDWERHYGPHWNTLVQAKRRYDPDTVFASGPDIFRHRS